MEKVKLIITITCIVISSQIVQAQTSVFFNNSQVEASDGTIYKKKPTGYRVNNITTRIDKDPELTSHPFPSQFKFRWTMIEADDFNAVLNESLSKDRLLQLSQENRMKIVGYANRTGQIEEVFFYISPNSSLTANELRIIEKAVLSMRTDFYYYSGDTLGATQPIGKFNNANSIPEFANIKYFPVTYFLTFNEAYQAIRILDSRTGKYIWVNESINPGPITIPEEDALSNVVFVQ